MRIVTRCIVARRAAERWLNNGHLAPQWQGKALPTDKPAEIWAHPRFGAAYAKLLGLGPSPDPDAVDEIVGPNYTRTQCDECGRSCDEAIDIADAALLCIECLRRAMATILVDRQRLVEPDETREAPMCTSSGDPLPPAISAGVQMVGGRWVAYYGPEILANRREPYDQSRSDAYMPLPFSAMIRVQLPIGVLLIERPTPDEAVSDSLSYTEAMMTRPSKG